MKKIISIILSTVLMLCISISLIGCVKQKEDCIPETLGKAEGLYLYYNNYRSLTDGTQTETLLNEITVDGVTYTSDEYRIVSLKYMTNKKEIFYSLETQKEGEPTKYFLWHYNYDTKENGWMRTFDYYTIVYTSNSYVFAYSYNTYGGTPMESALFDGNLNFITDDFEGKYRLKDNYLYKDSFVGKFSWWKDGKFYEIDTIYKNIDGNDVFLTGDYAYLFYENVLFLIDMNTGEYKTHTFAYGEVMWDRTDSVGSQAFFDHSGDKKYCITSSQSVETNLRYLPLRTGCKLWTLEKLEITHVYTFDETYQVNFYRCNDLYLNFKIERFETHLSLKDRIDKFYGYYDLETNKFVKGKTKTEKEKEKERFKIGDYEFYIDCVQYGPIMLPYECYYLHRVTDGKDEILQYYFDEDNGWNDINPILFDDIHTR